MSERTRRKFTDEFKDGAVKLVTDQGYSVAGAARNLGVNANLLGRWKKDSIYPDSELLSPGSCVAMQAELKRLRKENKLLKLEREILKKGSGLLCQGTGVRYHFIDTKKKVYPISLLCRVMQVRRSGFYSWTSRDQSERVKERER